MTDYSRFDKINYDDSDDDLDNVKSPKESTTIQGSNTVSEAPPPPVRKTPKGSDKNRLRFEHEGRLIYEWEQSLEEVNIYIVPPAGLIARDMDIVLSHDRVRIGVKGTPPFIDEGTGGSVKKDESFWTFADGEVNINLQKAKKGSTWDCALVGVSGQNTKIDDFTREEAKKNIMLQRFQEEHPGFDFSGADFNGNVPDATEFMGGIRYT
mmetsp:Transcript_15641/g.26073  ORF Transcript_15641/g.26073 Transcript_15641/m.26073 type:complete len:209 (-) Transcript_15641:2294-2920(-)